MDAPIKPLDIFKTSLLACEIFVSRIDSLLAKFLLLGRIPLLNFEFVYHKCMYHMGGMESCHCWRFHSYRMQYLTAGCDSSRARPISSSGWCKFIPIGCHTIFYWAIFLCWTQLFLLGVIHVGGIQICEVHLDLVEHNHLDREEKLFFLNSPESITIWRGSLTS